MTLRLALLGAGRIGQVHAVTVHKDERAELAAVADAFPAAAEAVSKKFGCPVMIIDAIAEDASIDGVIICTPTNTHADLIEQFSHAKKAIFCEKPIDLSVERVEKCLKTVRETSAVLMLGFNRRFDPDMAALQRAVADGRVGEVEQVQITSRDPAPPPIDYINVSGGIFRDMMIHDVDMARFIMGEDPVSVMARGSVLVDKAIGEAGDFDTASAILTTASGKQAVISISRRATYGYDQRVEVHGSKGMAAIENQRDTSVQIASENGYLREPLKDFFMERYMPAYAAELTEFIDAVESGRAPVPTGEDGLIALKIADAATRSAHENREIEV